MLEIYIGVNVVNMFCLSVLMGYFFCLNTYQALYL